MKLRQRILDGKGMPADCATCATSFAIPISKGKGDIMNCGMYSGVKQLEHAMNITEKVHLKRLRNEAIDDMQFGFKPGKGTIDAVFILWRIQEE